MFKIKDRVEFIPGLNYPDYDATADIEVINNNIKELEKNAKEQDTQIKSKEPKITRTDSPENDGQKVFTALGALNLKNWLVTNYTALMNNIKEVLDTKIETIKTSINGKLNHGGYGGTGQDLKNAVDGKVSKSGDTIDGVLRMNNEISGRRGGRLADDGNIFFNVDYSKPAMRGKWFHELVNEYLYSNDRRPTYKDVGALRKIELPQFTLTGNNPNPDGTNTFTLKLKLKQVGSAGWDFIMDITSSWSYSDMTGSSRYLIKFSKPSNSIQCLYSNMNQGYELRFGHVRNENGFVLIDVYYGAGSNPFAVNLYETSAYIESAVIENIRTAKPFGRSYATCKKLLWSGDLGTGSFTLNEDIRNYDKILFFCTDDTNSYMSGQIYDVETLKEFKASNKRFNINTQLEGVYWYVTLGDDFRTLVMQTENSRVRMVYGVND